MELLFIVYSYMLLKFQRKISIYGEINKESIMSINDEINNDLLKQWIFYRVLVTSNGGDVRSLMELIKLSDLYVDKIFLYKECLSACATYILTAKADVTASDRAVIGLHGDADTALLKIEQSNFLDKYKCVYNDALPIKQFRLNKGLNYQSVAENSIRRLKINSPAPSRYIYGDKGCLGATFTMSYRMWFPTSKQISEIYHKKISGNLCNDSENCIRTYAISRWKSDKDIVIGDKVIL